MKNQTEKSQISPKKQALNRAVKQITKEFGKGSIMRMGDSPFKHIKVIPTGSLAIDHALGVGGYPRGRVTEIFGPESAGKTTLALEATAECQKQGGTVAYIDAENALDPAYAKNLGVDIDKLLLSQPSSGEQGLQICDALVSSGAVDLVVVDSVAALVPKAEIQGEMGDQTVGLQARMMSQALRKLSNIIYKTRTAVIFINQLREKVGVMFGNPETTPGGLALKFYSSIMLEIRSGRKIKKGTDIIGRQAKVTIKKNKVAPPLKRCIVDIMYGTGVSHSGELIDMAVNKDLISKGGAWFTIAGQRLQGRENAKKYLVEHPSVMSALTKKVKAAYHIPDSDQDSAKSTTKKTNQDNSATKDSKNKPKN